MMTEISSKDVKSPRDMYNGWRRRNSYPRADEAVRIAQNLGVTVEYLVTGEDSEIGKDFYCKYKGYENLLEYLPKLNNSAVLATFPARSAARGISLMVPTL